MSYEESQPIVRIFSWQYVAGLFDGEGCVYYWNRTGSPQIRLSIAQSGDIGLRLLTDLKAWLSMQGVKANLEIPKKVFGVSTKLAYSLRIYRRDSVNIFLDEIEPFVYVKRSNILKARTRYLGYEIRKYKQKDLDLNFERCII